MLGLELPSAAATFHCSVCDTCDAESHPCVAPMAESISKLRTNILQSLMHIRPCASCINMHNRKHPSSAHLQTVTSNISLLMSCMHSLATHHSTAMTITAKWVLKKSKVTFNTMHINYFPLSDQNYFSAMMPSQRDRIDPDQRWNVAAAEGSSTPNIYWV